MAAKKARSRSVSKSRSRVDKKRRASAAKTAGRKEIPVKDRGKTYGFGEFDFREYGGTAGGFARLDKDPSTGTGYRQAPPERAQDPAEFDKDYAEYLRRKARKAEANVITSDNRHRLILGFGVLLFLMVVLIFRMGYWQIVRADDLRAMATDMQKVDTSIDPVRGTIYDSKMNVLAETVTEYELYGYTQYLYKDPEIRTYEKNKTVTDLMKITGQSEAEVRAKLEDEENLVLLAKGLNKEQIDKAEKLWPGKILVKTSSARYYPNGPFAAQVLGGVNADNVGRTGLEYQYNSTLAGVKGRTVRTTDRDGNTVSGSKSKYYEPQDGKNIVTTIDSVIQNFVEEALETGMKKTGAEAIVCIVMDPKTGNILAMASVPEYDPNESNLPLTEAEREKFAKMTPDEQTEYLSRMWTVRGISNIYEPGSTFKLITAASAIESNKSTDKDRYNCNGSINVSGYNLHCLGVHGKQTLKKAVGNSCNPALAKVALDMGADTFYNYIDLFGFRDKTGIDLPGETNSMVKYPDSMTKVDLATTGYGQGIAVTPLQILTAVCCFGNDGVLMKPKLVKEITDKDGNVIETIEDTEVRQVVSEETAAQMRDIMEYYVADAGGSEAYVPGYRVGGKTGTANLVDNGKYSKSSTNTSFVAMAPMDDPQLAMIVIVYRPTKMQYGNYTAGPIVKEVMEKSLQYLGVERKYTKEEEADAKKDLVKVPNITGKDSKEAIRILKNKKFKYKIVPDDTDTTKSFVVIDQFPKAGTKVQKKSTVYIYSQ